MNRLGMVIRFANFAIIAIAAVASAQTKPFLRIISPANGAVVRPGQKLSIKVMGAGEYPGVGVIGPDMHGIIVAPLGKPPWTISVVAPAEPGRTYFTATGTTVSGVEVDSNQVEVDVEPEEVTPVTFSPPSLLVAVGACVTLTDESGAICGQALNVNSRDLKGELVNMNRSTKINFTSLSPAIAKVSRDGSTLIGVSAGSAKITVFGKYTVDVTVR